MALRVVLQHTVGRFAGLHRIVGTIEELRESLKVTGFPQVVEDVNFIDHVGYCVCVKVKPLYVLYREMIEAVPVVNLDPAQQ